MKKKKIENDMTADDAEKVDYCEWVQDDDGNYGTSCGQAWVVEYGTPNESGYTFCPNCGKPIKVKLDEICR